MSNAISITVPREAALLTLAAKFLTDAAAHVNANPETLKVVHKSVGDVSISTASLGNSEELEEVISLVEETVDIPALEEVLDDVFIPADPVDVKSAFAPKPSIFDEPEPAAEPEYQMTEAAEGFTRDQYHASGWSDEALLKAGKMIEIVKTPAAPVAAAPAPTPAPTAPTPSTPTAPAPTPAPPTSGATASGATPTGELDSEGLPWDSRIHASTKTKMQSDNTWKLKRGVDKAEVERVKAQLRQLQGNAPAPAAAAAPAAQSGEKPSAALMRRITSAMTNKTIDNKTVLDAIRHPSVGLQEVRDICLPQNAHLVPIAEKLMFGG